MDRYSKARYVSDIWNSHGAKGLAALASAHCIGHKTAMKIIDRLGGDPITLLSPSKPNSSGINARRRQDIDHLGILKTPAGGKDGLDTITD